MSSGHRPAGRALKAFSSALWPLEQVFLLAIRSLVSRYVVRHRLSHQDTRVPMIVESAVCLKGLSRGGCCQHPSQRYRQSRQHGRVFVTTEYLGSYARQSVGEPQVANHVLANVATLRTRRLRIDKALA